MPAPSMVVRDLALKAFDQTVEGFVHIAAISVCTVCDASGAARGLDPVTASDPAPGLEGHLDIDPIDTPIEPGEVGELVLEMLSGRRIDLPASAANGYVHRASC